MTLKEHRELQNCNFGNLNLFPINDAIRVFLLYKWNTRNYAPDTCGAQLSRACGKRKSELGWRKRECWFNIGELSRCRPRDARIELDTIEISPADAIRIKLTRIIATGIRMILHPTNCQQDCYRAYWREIELFSEYRARVICLLSLYFSCALVKSISKISMDGLKNNGIGIDLFN